MAIAKCCLIFMYTNSCLINGKSILVTVKKLLIKM